MSQDLANLAIRVDSSAVAAASNDLNKLADTSKKVETATGSMNSGFDKLKQNWIAVSVAVVAFAAAMQKAIQYMELGAKALQVESSFKIMTDASGVAGKAMIDNMTKATRATIDDSDLMAKAVKLMVMGYDSTQIERFSKNVIAASQIAGVSVNDAFEMMADAIANKMPRALLKMGAITKDQMALVTKAIASGVDEMALYNLAMANLELRTLQLKGTQDQASISLQQFHKQVSETKEEIGKGLIDAMQKLYAVFQNLGAASLTASAAIYKLLEARNKIAAFVHSGDEAKAFLAAADEYKAMAAADTKAAAELDKKYRINMGLEKPEVQAKATEVELAKQQKLVDIEVQKTQAKVDRLKADEKAAAATEKAIEDAKKLREEWEKTAQALGGEQRLAGLEGIRKEFEQNLIDAEKMKTQYEKLPPAIREVAYALIDEAKKQKDAGVVTLTVQKNRADNTEAMKKEADELAHLKNEYDRLLESLSPTLAITTRYNHEIELLNKNLEAGKNPTALGGITQEQYDATKGMLDANQATNLAKIQADYYSQIEGYAQTAYDKKIKLIESERQANIKLYGDIGAANAKASQDQRTAFDEYQDAISKKFDTDNKYTNQVIANAGAALDAAMTCYDKDSSEYQQLANAKKAVQAAEIAMNIAKNATIIASNFGLISSSAAASITGASIGVGPTGLVTAAAMIGLLASVFAMYGIASSGNISVPSIPASVLPSSTVLGAEAGTGSTSIANSLKLMEDTYQMEDTKLTAIYNQLKDLNSNITGLVTSIVRTGGINSTEGINLGSTGSAGDVFLGGVTPSFNLDLVSGILATAKNFMNAIFGGGTRDFIQTQGIEIGQTIIKNILAGADVAAQQYTVVGTEHETGWFSKNWVSTETVYSALDQNVNDMLTLVFKNIGTTLMEVAKGLGTDVQAVLDYVFTTTRLDLQGKTTDEINTAISEWISNISDTAVDALFGTILKGYQKLNEGLLETAVRLVIDKEMVLEALKMTGQAFTGTIPQIIKFSETIIEMAGGLDKLTEAASTYFDKFFTDSEKQTRLQTQLTDVMAGMNTVLPSTRDGYRDLLEGLDLTTESGQKAYVILLQLSGVADTYYAYLEEVALKRADMEMQLLELTGTAEEVLAAKRKLELAALDETLRPLQELIWLTQDWADKIAEATKNTTSAIDAQISLSNSAANAARSAADAYKNMIDTLTEAQIKINGGGTAGAQGQFNTIFSKAMTGDQTSLAALPGAIDSLLANSLVTAQTSEDYARIQGKSLLALEDAKTISGAMVNWEEYQATLLETQTGVLEQIKDELALPNPDLVLLEKQAGLLETIGTLLSQQVVQIAQGNSDQILLMHDQTGQIVQANVLTQDQTGQIVMGNSWLATQVQATAGVQGAIGGQTAQIINGNLIIKDQNGLIISSNTLLTDQTGKIITGNALTGTQTTQVITGNAIQDAIKNISELNQNFTKEMLTALIGSGSTQNSSLQSILEANNKTVELIRTLIQLSITGDKEKMQAGVSLAQSDYNAAHNNMATAQTNYETARGNLAAAAAKEIGADTALEKAKADLIVKQKAYDAAPSTKTYTSIWGTTETEQEFWSYPGDPWANGAWTENISKDAAITKAYDDAKALVGTSETAFNIAMAELNAANALVNPLLAVYQKTISIMDAAMSKLNELTEAYWNKYPDERPPVIGTPMMYAEGGIFSNGIVSQPTMFNNSMMGENGPEAIMPLVRGPQGLGVRGSGNDNVISIEELRKIRASIEAGNLASVKNGNKIAKILSRFDDDGLPAVRTTS
jgi:hypothetical protein